MATRLTHDAEGRPHCVFAASQKPWIVGTRHFGTEAAARLAAEESAAKTFAPAYYRHEESRDWVQVRPAVHLCENFSCRAELTPEAWDAAKFAGFGPMRCPHCPPPPALTPEQEVRRARFEALLARSEVRL